MNLLKYSWKVGDALLHEENDRVQLDEILKSLFGVSNKVLVNMMNSLFNESFSPEETEVSFGKNELQIETDEYDVIRGDIFINMVSKQKPHHYHIELQTRNDSTMIIRMLDYGIQKAKELQKYEDRNNEEMVLYIPKQLVLYIEENKNIKDELNMRLVFPDGQEVKYIVPVMKYWTYDDKKLIEQQMYPLLPLQVFKLRHKLESLRWRKGDHKQEQIEIIYKAKEITTTIGEEAKRLFDQEKITGDDLHKILIANGNLFEYLNNKYAQIQNQNEEVHAKMKTLYDPALEKTIEDRIRIETAKTALEEGLPIALIKKLTGLEIEKIREIKNKEDSY